MATASPTKASAPSAAASKAASQVQVAAPSRREFLYYIWGASIVMLLGQAGAAIVWFALPRFREGEFGGTFRFTGADIPQVNTAPENIPAGRFWLSNSENGFLALYGVCTHLGCLPKWDEVNTRFSCPCHGSQFQLNGEWITGPAPRPMDRFSVTLTFADGTQISSDAEGNPINIGDRALDTVVDVAVNTGDRIQRPNHG